MQDIKNLIVLPVNPTCLNPPAVSLVLRSPSTGRLEESSLSGAFPDKDECIEQVIKMIENHYEAHYRGVKK